MIIKLTILLIANYIADYYLQPREIATTKSSNWKSMIDHLLSVWLVMIVPACVFYGYAGAIFTTVYVLLHGIQDSLIWRGYKLITYFRLRKEVNEKARVGGLLPPGVVEKMREREQQFKDNKEYAEDKRFYDFIGLDAVLHTITIVVLWSLL